METLEVYINSGEWVKLYSQHSHVHNFLYGIISFMVRDDANELRRTSEALVWYKNDVVRGVFPITVESMPTFQQTLLEILKTDEIVGKYLTVASNDGMAFRLHHPT